MQHGELDRRDIALLRSLVQPAQQGAQARRVASEGSDARDAFFPSRPLELRERFLFAAQAEVHRSENAVVGGSISTICRAPASASSPRPRSTNAQAWLREKERVEGVGPHALGALGEGLVEPPQLSRKKEYQVADVGIAGVRLDGLPVFRFRPRPVELKEETARQGEVAFGELGIQLQGLARMFFDPGCGLPRWKEAKVRERNITEGQGGVRQGEAGVLLDRLLQVAHALEQDGLHVVDPAGG